MLIKNAYVQADIGVVSYIDDNSKIVTAHTCTITIKAIGEFDFTNLRGKMNIELNKV